MYLWWELGGEVYFKNKFLLGDRNWFALFFPIISLLFLDAGRCLWIRGDNADARGGLGGGKGWDGRAEESPSDPSQIQEPKQLKRSGTGITSTVSPTEPQGESGTGEEEKTESEEKDRTSKA